ncbi:MAG TPA: PhoH family protein [Nitrospirales bacterium]|nr:PhoH family protein [Nitrospirales bacterium]
MGICISARGEMVMLKGPRTAVNGAGRLITDLSELVNQGLRIDTEDVHSAIQHVRDVPEGSVRSLFSDGPRISTAKRTVHPKSVAQRTYLQAIGKSDIVVGIGPAGTGKTYLAMGAAISALNKKLVQRIILTRPAVEAGERLGFLPGDLNAKIDPYLRPLYDALFDLVELEQATRLIEIGNIEIAPLAFMRGRTLNDSFIILDEAQNTTSEQMKMLLTRLGFNSKLVVTGDVTQIDLPRDRDSGLEEIREILADIEGIEFVHFSEQDVVRHRLVKDIIKAYDRHGRNTQKTRGARHEKPHAS